MVEKHNRTLPAEGVFTVAQLQRNKINASCSAFVRLRRSNMHQKRPVRPFVTIVCCAKTAESIELPFVVVSGIGNRVLDGLEHWRHLANTVERTSVHGCYEWVCHQG